MDPWIKIVARALAFALLLCLCLVVCQCLVGCAGQALGCPITVDVTQPMLIDGAVDYCYEPSDAGGEPDAYWQCCPDGYTAVAWETTWMLICEAS